MGVRVSGEFEEKACGAGNPCDLADAWVRRHGGLAKCAEMAKFFEAMHDGLYGTDAEKRRSGDEMASDVLSRLMPEGMEWPCYESGEKVRPGDKLLDKDGDWFEAVSFVLTCDWWSIRGYQTEGFGDLNERTRRTLEGMAYGTRVKRAAAKALGADGELVSVGDEVYSTTGYGPFTVSAIWDAQPARPKGVERRPGAEIWMALTDGPDGLRFLVNDLVHELPEERCGVCLHFQKNPGSVDLGVCWESLTERKGEEVFLACFKGDRACSMFDRRQGDEEGER